MHDTYTMNNNANIGELHDGDPPGNAIYPLWVLIRKSCRHAGVTTYFHPNIEYQMQHAFDRPWEIQQEQLNAIADSRKNKHRTYWRYEVLMWWRTK